MPQSPGLLVYVERRHSIVAILFFLSSSFFTMRRMVTIRGGLLSFGNLTYFTVGEGIRSSGIFANCNGRRLRYSCRLFIAILLHAPRRYDVTVKTFSAVQRCRAGDGVCFLMMMMKMMMKLPILPCAEKLELVLSTAPRT